MMLFPQNWDLAFTILKNNKIIEKYCIMNL